MLNKESMKIKMRMVKMRGIRMMMMKMNNTKMSMEMKAKMKLSSGKNNMMIIMKVPWRRLMKLGSLKIQSSKFNQSKTVSTMR